MKWLKWLSWEKDPKKQSGSAEWGPIIKFWIYGIAILTILLIVAGAWAFAPIKLS
tara:strand:+ start:1270 stop:1434 length:165 start_codon:yes stop_codon:yes gene_type:complete